MHTTKSKPPAGSRPRIFRRSPRRKIRRSARPFRAAACSAKRTASSSSSTPVTDSARWRWNSRRPSSPVPLPRSHTRSPGFSRGKLPSRKESVRGWNRPSSQTKESPPGQRSSQCCKSSPPLDDVYIHIIMEDHHSCNGGHGSKEKAAWARSGAVALRATIGASADLVWPLGLLRFL